MPDPMTQTPSRATAALTETAPPATAPPGYAVLPRLAPPPLPDNAPSPGVTPTPDAAHDPGAASAPELAPADVPPVPDLATCSDANAVCLVTVPQTAPPYDDSPADDSPLADHQLANASALTPFALAASALTPSALAPSTQAAASTHSPTTGETSPGGGTPIGPMPTARPARASSGPWRPPSGHWPSQFAQILAETLSGSRPASHLALWTSVRTRRRIMQLASVLATPHRPRIRRVIVTSPANGVLEMSVIAIFGTRVRALAIRMERRSVNGEPDQATDQSAPAAYPSSAEGWQCTAVEAA